MRDRDRPLARPHLSGQIKFDCADSCSRAGEFSNPDEPSAVDCLSSKSKNERLANGTGTLPKKKVEKWCREWKMFALLFRIFVRHVARTIPVSATLEMSICSDRRVIFSRFAPLRNDRLRRP